jgi:hypothetical protein
MFNILQWDNELQRVRRNFVRACRMSVRDDERREQIYKLIALVFPPLLSKIDSGNFVRELGWTRSLSDDRLISDTLSNRFEIFEIIS